MNWSKQPVQVANQTKSVPLWKQNEELAKKSGARSTTFSLNGDSYKGEWAHDKKEGHGVYVWADGRTYDGEWKNDLRHGTGEYFVPNDKGELVKIYTGEWRNGMQDGQGTYFYTSGDVYEGGWRRDLRHGQGVLVYKNGDRYVGNWVDDKRSGEGQLIHPSGNFYDGLWENNEKEGKGVYYYVANGQRMDGIWVLGVCTNGVVTATDASDPPKPARPLPALGLKDPDAIIRKA
eukprot:TRINITY_DN18931_c0_g1_i1.p1 TRINITY_DN18931_c0_g1~~TRINITY_DN18931_c0_g1_i1.p1  ORF type:complete len:233 (-),score=65.36 TRINITY_DN18931_c0_g1_i1:101-799(-)